MLKIIIIFTAENVQPPDMSCRVGMHGYPANYLLSGQIVAFFTICLCIWPETTLLSVSGWQNANRYLKK